MSELLDRAHAKLRESEGGASATRRAAPTGALDKKAAIEYARKALAPNIRSAPPYPVEALGPLADACQAIADEGQLEPAMAGQCLLGAASLLTQGLCNVRTLAGIKPLSLALLTFGDSGDGKTTAESAALAPVAEWQRVQSKAFRLACEQRADAKEAAPRAPHRLVQDPTVEGLRRDLDTGPCSQGIFSSEGASMLTGYGMSAEHRAKTAAVLNGLWDSGHLSVSRATGGRVERYGCRLAIHLLIQPSIAAEVVGDPALTAIGLWPRFMLAWPAPGAPRKARVFDPAKLPAVGRYWQRCMELLAQALPEDATDCPVICADGAAQSIVEAAFERFEVEGKRGTLRVVKPFALRGTEQLHRVAAVQAAFAGRHAITAEDARNALALTIYSVDTWRALIDEGAADPTAHHALRLYEWLLERAGLGADVAQLTRTGPACIRSRDRRDSAIEMLLDHRLCARIGGAIVATVGGRDGAA